MTWRSALQFSVSKCSSFPATWDCYLMTEFLTGRSDFSTFVDILGCLDQKSYFIKWPTEKSFIVICLRILLSSIMKRPLRVWPGCSRYAHNPLRSDRTNLKEVNSSLFQVSLRGDGPSQMSIQWIMRTWHHFLIYRTASLNYITKY